MIIVLILVGVYVLSCYGTYLFMQKVYYNEKGIWYDIKPTNTDVTCCFVPFLNTTITISYIFSGWKKSVKKTKETTFFKPKQQNL